MSEFRQVLVKSLVSSMISGTWTYFCMKTGVVVWISFVTWALYFLCLNESNLHKLTQVSLRLGTGLIAGILFGIGIVLGMPYFSNLLGADIALSFVLLPIAIVIASQMGRIPLFSFVPAYFVGTAVFFAFDEPLSFSLLIKILVPALCGVLLGHLTILAHNFSMALFVNSESRK